MASLLLPHSAPLRWWAIYGAVGVFAVFGLTAGIAAHMLRTTSRLPYWIHVCQILLASLAIGLGSVGGGGGERRLESLLVLLVLVSSSFRRRGLAQFGWVAANLSLVASALVVGMEPGYVLTLALNFAAVSAMVASIMVFFRNSLATAIERSSDLAYLAAVSARAATIRAAIDESKETIRRVTGASEVLLVPERPPLLKSGDYWIDLGHTSRGPIFLALLDTSGIDEAEVATVADLFRPVVARDGVFADLQTLSMTDSLSGLANRRGLDQFLATHCLDPDDVTWNDGDEAFGERPDVSVVLLDLDHFKDYNDVNGHLAGDLVLKDLGETLRQGVRGSDLAARYGGEEFCLVLVGDPAAAIPLLNRVRQDWSAVHPEIKFSAGVAVWDRKEDAQSLLARSDAALYESKEQGRDRTTIAVVGQA